MVIFGCLCLLAAAGITFYNMYDDARAFRVITAENLKLEAVLLSPEKIRERAAEASPSPSSEPSQAPDQELTPPEPTPEPYIEMAVIEIDNVQYSAMLSIPKLSLELSVRNNWSYPDLKNSPCRYYGSAFMHDLVICGHNYSSHFGRLKELEKGDEVLLVDVNGVLFTYSVEEIETLGPFDVLPMTNSGFDLTLFTCTVGGKKRVTVRCSLVEMTNPPN